MHTPAHCHIYLEYYPPVGAEQENKKRYLLDFAIDPKGNVYKSDEEIKEITINGHCPWPYNSPFLQVLEWHQFPN